MQNGIDKVLTTPILAKIKNSRLGLVTNNASKSAEGEFSRISLLKAGFHLVKLFSPEHGISAKGIDGAFQQDKIDEKTELPIISLYGSAIKPSNTNLSDIDVLLFDMPDVGCRFYTYLWTMTYVMEACAECGVKLIVLDRPNPIGIDLSHSEGPYLNEDACNSFIGRWSIPIRHSCTLGELALYFKALKVPSLDLEIIGVSNYSRWSNPIINISPWTPPSPAIRTQLAAYLYPGLGLLEGININEGRGTEDPFTICGAPFIDSQYLIHNLEFEAVKIQPIEYIPGEGLYTGEKCYGIKFSQIHEKNIMPVSLGIQLLSILMKLYPGIIKQRLYKTNVNPSGENHLNRLIGVPGAFEKLKTPFEFKINIQDDWVKKIKPYLIY